MKKTLLIIFIITLSFGCQNSKKATFIKAKEYVKPSVTINLPTKNDEIKFIKTEKTLNKQLEKFIGKTVFIDTWFTSCGSCIKQFKYVKDLEKFFNENDIVSLYICFGDAKEKDKWKELVDKYQLKGYHLFLESKNVIEYKSTFNIKKLKKSLFHGAPRFLIIDKNGNLVDGFAPRPVEKQKLIDIINKSLKK